VIVDFNAHHVGWAATVVGPKLVQLESDAIKRNDRTADISDRKIFRIEKRAAAMKDGTDMVTDIERCPDVACLSKVEHHDPVA
jgi:hypothetical protein